MTIAITIGTVVKKALELLAVNDSGRKFLGYVLCIAVFLLLLPVIVVCGLFGWMANDGGTLLLREELLNNLPEENAAVIEQMNTVCDTIQNVFEIKGLSVTDERKAEAIYLTCLVGREDDENFYNDLADCFLYADAENDVFDWITAVFGVEIAKEDREMIEKIE